MVIRHVGLRGMMSDRESASRRRPDFRVSSFVRPSRLSIEGRCAAVLVPCSVLVD